MCGYNFLKYKYFRDTNFSDKQHNGQICNKPFWLQKNLKIKINREKKINFLWFGM